MEIPFRTGLRGKCEIFVKDVRLDSLALEAATGNTNKLHLTLHSGRRCSHPLNPVCQAVIYRLFLDIMGQRQMQELKAGPSERPRWNLETSKWRRQAKALIMAGPVVAFFLMGYFSFGYFSAARHDWTLRWPGDESRLGGWQEKSSRGSQYLLGVGKADITG